MQRAETETSTYLAHHPAEVYSASFLRQHRHLPRGEARLESGLGVDDVRAVRAAEVLLTMGKSTGDSNGPSPKLFQERGAKGGYGAHRGRVPHALFAQPVQLLH